MYTFDVRQGLDRYDYIAVCRETGKRWELTRRPDGLVSMSEEEWDGTDECYQAFQAVEALS